MDWSLSVNQLSLSVSPITDITVNHPCTRRMRGVDFWVNGTYIAMLLETPLPVTFSFVSPLPNRLLYQNVNLKSHINKRC